MGTNAPLLLSFLSAADNTAAVIVSSSGSLAIAVDVSLRAKSESIPIDEGTEGCASRLPLETSQASHTFAKSDESELFITTAAKLKKKKEKNPEAGGKSLTFFGFSINGDEAVCAPQFNFDVRQPVSSRQPLVDHRSLKSHPLFLRQRSAHHDLARRYKLVAQADRRSRASRPRRLFPPGRPRFACSVNLLAPFLDPSSMEPTAAASPPAPAPIPLPTADFVTPNSRRGPRNQPATGPSSSFDMEPAAQLPRQLPSRVREESTDTSQGISSHRTSTDSRPSTATSTQPSSVPPSQFASSPVPSAFPSQNSTSYRPLAPPVAASPRSPAKPSTSSSARHQNFDSTLSAGPRSTRASHPSRSPFKKALAALGLSEKDKARKDERSANGFTREEKPKMGPVDSAREQGRRVMRYVKRKLNSKTPKEELPKTWEEYGKAYAAQNIDVDDPPLPPAQPDAESSEPTPFDQRVYNAPRPENEVVRQNVVNRLDLFGTRAKASLANPQSPRVVDGPLDRSTAPSVSNASTTSLPLTSTQAGLRRGSTTGSLNSTAASVLDDGIEAPASDSLENHPIFRSIVSRCREVFNTKVGLITILDDDQQLFLAAGGMPDGVDKLPRDVTFCSHAILGEEKGMVVLDTQKDWRFANNLPSTALGARFYAGVPLFARTSGQDSAPSVPIGTICVADVVPREEFTEAHRRVLRDFATQASNAIEQWASQRMAIKLARLHGSLPNASLPDLPKLQSNEVGLLTPPSSAGLPPATNASSASLPVPTRPKTAPSQVPLPPSFPASPPPSVRPSHNTTLHSRNTSTASTSSTVASSIASSAVPPSSHAARPSTALAFAITTEDPVSLVPRDLQKMFDTATKMLAKALALDLVYLAALDLHILPEPSLRILSARGLPSPAPSFDPNLHLKALRSPEGGLVYKNPRFVSNGSGSYSSGILIPVIEVRRVGYVLCGYTQQPDREFVQRDLGYLVRFAEQLEAGCAKLGRSDQVSALMARSSSAASASSTGSIRGRYD